MDLSLTDLAAIFVPIIAAALPVILSPRLYRISVLRRRDILRSLAAISPTFKEFRSGFSEPSVTVKIVTDLGGLFAVLGPLSLVQAVGQPNLLIGEVLLVFGLLLVPQFSFTWNEVAAFRELEHIEKGSQPPSERAASVPSIAGRIFLIDLAILLGIGLLVAAKPTLITEGTGLVLFPIAIVSAVVYAAAALGAIADTENRLFGTYLRRTGCSVHLELHLQAADGSTSGAIRGTLEGIGEKLRFQRDDDFVELIGWSTVGRFATPSGP